MSKKPLLTDEVIEEDLREREDLEAEIHKGIESDKKLAKKYSKKEKELEKQSTHKSRRIENAKTKKRGKILDRAILVTIIILLFLIYAIINWI